MRWKKYPCLPINGMTLPPGTGTPLLWTKKIITIYAGSGSLFLDDVFQIDVEEEQQ